jgi:hypothetical protein
LGEAQVPQYLQDTLFDWTFHFCRHPAHLLPASGAAGDAAQLYQPVSRVPASLLGYLSARLFIHLGMLWGVDELPSGTTEEARHTF